MDAEPWFAMDKLDEIDQILEWMDKLNYPERWKHAMIEINRDGIIIMDRPKWEKRVTMREVPFYKCPRCKVEQPHRSKFCPNCGLQLRGFKNGRIEE